tara:strand:+ start:25360 stop:26325 length:966 start_codon:yes stop_codon:yes gene_type:complete
MFRPGLNADEAIFSLLLTDDFEMRCQKCFQCRFRGYTLIETIVALGIFAILISLASVGLQAARETARQAQCQNNLRQVGLAVQIFENRNGSFPTNGGYMREVFRPLPGLLRHPLTVEFAAGHMYRWGVGHPLDSVRQQSGSWAYSLLPHLEQTACFEARTTETSVLQYRCPSRGEREPSRPAPDRWGRYDGGTRIWAKTDYAANGRIIRNAPDVARRSDLLTGSAHLICIGEKAHHPQIQTPTSWLYDEPYFLGGSLGTRRSNANIRVDGTLADYQNGWGSAHRDRSHFVYFDGSVRGINHSIDRLTFIDRLNPSHPGNEP